MLALAIAFRVVHAPCIFTDGFFNATTHGNGLFIDLGYHLNLGQSVVVKAIHYTFPSTGPKRDPDPRKNL